MKNRIFNFVILVLALILFGCPNTVLPTPTYSNSQDSSSMSFSESTYWGAPSNLSASQGLKGRIELSWGGGKISI